MSADGPGLFDDDTAVDVRGEFTELLARLRDRVAATSEIESDWLLGALADCEVKVADVT